MSAKHATLTVQKWGNSLAVRIPASIARSAHFQIGTPVELTLQEVGVSIKPVGERNLTLSERLELFDPKKHRGEVMISERVGAEEF